MVAEVLGRSFSKLVNTGCVKGIKPATAAETEVLQQFVDDTFLFGESFIMKAGVWKNILRNYEDNLGQQINYSKSKLYFFNTDDFMQRKIRNI